MKRMLPEIAATLVALTGLLFCAGSAVGLAPTYSVSDARNRHNLSATGTGDINITMAPDQVQICIFCHIPHHSTSVTPLWSRDIREDGYTPYYSTTLNPTALPGQPAGVSRLCLSCHDGTIALGMLVLDKQISTLQALPVNRRSNLTTDLSNDHPISFDYAAVATFNSSFRQPAALDRDFPQINLDNGRVECTACHDPHRDAFPPQDKPLESGKFLVLDNSSKSALCTACHTRPGLTEGVHFTEKEACEKCHTPHQAPQAARLLKGTNNQNTCLANCHNSPEANAVTGVNIAGTFTGTTKAHTVAISPKLIIGAHDANEDPSDFSASATHVECVDCHNPCLAQHETTPLSAPPAINGRLVNVLIDKSDGTKTFAATEYDICFKCHGSQPFTPPAVTRQLMTGDQSLRFDTSNPAYHPVKAPTVAGFVPSLRLQIDKFINPTRSLTTNSMIYCTDCHNSDNAAKTGGSGPSGPHGSKNRHILIDTYKQDIYPEPYVVGNYDLCNRCHNLEGVLFTDSSNFPKHAFHVKTMGVSCAVCHDPHGVYGGTAEANAHLINFDTSIVATGIYNSTNRSCTAIGGGTNVCHATNPKTY